MTKEPIFELYLDPKEKSDRHCVRIYVDLNGIRRSLTDALYSIDAAFIDKDFDQEDSYLWQWPEDLYESVMEAEKGKRKYIRPVRSNLLNFRMAETEAEIIWSPVLVGWGWSGGGNKELTAEDGIMPKGFTRFPFIPILFSTKNNFMKNSNCCDRFMKRING